MTAASAGRKRKGVQRRARAVRVRPLAAAWVGARQRRKREMSLRRVGWQYLGVEGGGWRVAGGGKMGWGGGVRNEVSGVTMRKGWKIWDC